MRRVPRSSIGNRSDVKATREASPVPEGPASFVKPKPSTVVGQLVICHLGLPFESFGPL